MPLDPIKDFQDDGASFRVRRLAQLERMERGNSPIIIQGDGYFARWMRRTSGPKIFTTIIVGGLLFFAAYFVLAFAGLLVYDAITRL